MTKFTQSNVEKSRGSGLSGLAQVEYQANPVALNDTNISVLQGDGFGNLKVSVVGGSSSSVGGGNNTYSTEAGDITGAIVNGTKGITITIVNTQLGTPTALNFAEGSVQRNRGGVFTTCPLTNVVYTGGVLSLPDMTDSFATGDTVTVTCVGADKQVVLESLNKTDDSITSYPVGHSNKFIEALGDSDAIKTGAGVLHSINVYPGSSDAYIVVRDSLDGNSGDVIALLGGANVGCYVFDIAFATGLSVNSAGTTTCKFSISYR